MVRLFDLNDLPSLQEPPSKRKKTGESSSENEGRLDNSRSNDGLLLKGETGFVSAILPLPIELESNGSSEDNHVSSENGGRLDNSRSNDDSLLTVGTEPSSPGTEPLSPRTFQDLLCPTELEALILQDFLCPTELESNGSPDREDNHLSSKNEGRLHYSRSNDGSLLVVGTEPSSPGTEPLSPLTFQDLLCPTELEALILQNLSCPTELESNGSPDREDNHLSSKNEGRLHYSRSNDGSLLMVGTEPSSPGTEPLSPLTFQDLLCPTELEALILQNLSCPTELESNGSPDREDNHLSSKNEGRLHYSRSNDGSLLMVGTEPSSPGTEPLSPLTFQDLLCPTELESNGSPDREDNHLSSKNEGRLHYSRSNDDLWMKLNNIPGGGTGSRIGKLFVSNTEIAKGSNGTIVFDGFYELRPVAVKRLVKGLHDDNVFNEIKNLIEADRHPNIVRYYGVEYDQYFVYLALERCACSLDDLIQAHSESSNNSIFPNDPASTVGYKSKLDSIRDAMQDVNLWSPDGHPSPFLLKLMRDVVSGLTYLHVLGIIHRDLKPQNVLITKNPSVGAQLCDMGISRCLPQDKSSLGYHAAGCGTSGWQAPEQLCCGRQTRAMDMFSLGCVLFFCVTGGRHPFGECLERDINIKNNKMDLSLVASIPEAHDLISLLLNPEPKLRPKSLEVFHHPFFWSSEMRLSFFRDTSDRVLLEVASAPNSDLLNELESKAPLVFAGNWDNKIEPIFMADIRKKRYDYSRVRDLLRAVRNKWAHHIELSEEVKELIGRDVEGFDNYFAKRFPRLLMLSYEVVSQFCKEEGCFRKYFGS